MGSFIARDYISKYGEELDGVTLCGTMGVWPDFEDAKNYIDKIVESGKTKESDPDIPKKLLGWMFGRCTEGVTRGNGLDSLICLDRLTILLTVFQKTVC